MLAKDTEKDEDQWITHPHDGKSDKSDCTAGPEGRVAKDGHLQVAARKREIGQGPIAPQALTHGNSVPIGVPT